MKHNLQLLLKKCEDLIAHDHTGDIRDLTTQLHPSQIADLLEAMPIGWEKLWESLDPSVQGEILLELESEELRQQLIAHTSTEDLLIALEKLSPDEQADLFDQLPDKQAKQLLAAMKKQDREMVEQALQYDKNTAGGIMHVDTITVSDSMTLDSVMAYLRGLKNMPNRIDRLFVVDNTHRHKGILRIASLLLHPGQTLVKSVAEQTTTIHHSTPVGEVARMFDDLQLLRAPVVDDSDTLLGHIVINNVVNVMRRETRTIENNAALLPENVSWFSPIIASTKRRSVWLGLNLLTAFLASFIISLFSDTLEKIIALAILLPIVASMGGIAGHQTLTLVVRGIATHQIGQSNFKQLLSKEFLVGILSGVIWALSIGILAWSWFGHIGLGVIIGSAIIVTLCCATVSGVAVPFTVKAMGIDPAFSGGALITTITDVIGITVFLGLATLFLI